MIFQRLPRIGRLVGFGQLNPSGRASVALPRMPFKWCCSSSTHSRPHSWLILSSSLTHLLNTSKSSISFPLFHYLQKPSKILQNSKSPNFTWNPNCLTWSGRPWHPRQVQNGKEKSQFARIHLPILTIPGIPLLKPSKDIQLEPSLFVELLSLII